MSLFGFLNRRSSAPVARERLQILLAHERKSARDSDLIAALQKDVLAAIAKHISIAPGKVAVKMHPREDNMSMLEIEIEIDSDAVKEEPDAVKEEAASEMAA